MKLFYFSSIALLILLGFGCNKEYKVAPEDPQNYEQYLFILQKTNAEDSFSSKVTELINNKITTDWSWTDFESIRLIKSIGADMILNNEDTLRLGIWFIKYLPLSDTTLLVLDDREEPNKFPKNWDFKSSETEIQEFYKTFAAARIFIDDQAIEHDELNDSFKLIAETKTQDLQEKTYLTVYFSGETYYLENPDATNVHHYNIIGGTYSGFSE